MKLLINKCFICIGFLSLLFVLSYSLVINSNNECGKKIEIDCKEYTNKNQFVKSAMDTKVIEDEPEIEEKLKKGCVVVNVKTMCDSSYQNAHKKDWKVRAKKITKKATSKLYTNFNISFKPKKAVSCSTKKSNNANTIYKDFAEKYKVSGKIDMIVGLSGQNPKGVAGISYVGKVEGGPRVLVFASTYDSEAETIQHEIGHTYDLEHCEKDCVMKTSGFGYLNKFCKSHKKQWNNNRKYY